MLEVVGLAKKLIGKAKPRKIDILQNLEGVVHSGEMLVVLGPPGRYVLSSHNLHSWRRPTGPLGAAAVVAELNDRMATRFDNLTNTFIAAALHSSKLLRAKPMASTSTRNRQSITRESIPRQCTRISVAKLHIPLKWMFISLC